MERIQQLSSQISSKKGSDIVICCSIRTPLTKSKRGPLKDVSPEQLLAPLLKEIIKKTGINPKNVDDIIIGNVLQSGAGVYASRMAQFLAGFPNTVTTLGINRLCSSGLEAISQVCSKIQAGIIDVGIAGGVENMSMYDMKKMVEKEYLSNECYQNDKVKDCLLPMGITSENVAKNFGISREKQDKFAVESHRKAAEAQEKGYFESEIVPITVQIKEKDGSIKTISVTKDDGIRKDSNFAGLSKLKPAFSKEGSTTAGNSSQLTDGAALVLLARRDKALELGLPILAKYISYAVAGVPPDVMGVGPAYAIPLALQKAGLTTDNINVYEINEAFASQATYCIEKLNLDYKKVNPKGGAIALGHPLGATGARQMATLISELIRTKSKYGVVSMCIGTGMGAAMVVENEIL